MSPEAKNRAQTPIVGQTVAGRYELLRLLAQGGMGAVYEARNTATRKRCALKLLLASEIDADSPAVRRFLQESRSSSAVESDHIVQVFDAGLDEESGAPYLVMELLRGEDLRALSTRLQVLPPELVSRLAAQAATGLAKAHAAGVVHRDVKPANLFLTERDNGEHLLKVVDFGIAKVKSHAGLDTHDSLTQGGHVLGTPAYMSPEQARGEAEARADADVWSLGIVMYELLTGRLPYSRTAPLATLMAAIVTEPMPDLQQIAPWVPRPLAQIVQKATARDRRERYRDGSELRDALLEACRHDTRIARSMLRTLPASERQQPAGALPAPFLGDDRRSTVDLPATSPAPTRSVMARYALIGVGLAATAGALAWVVERAAAPEQSATSKPSSPVPASAPAPAPVPVRSPGAPVASVAAPLSSERLGPAVPAFTSRLRSPAAPALSASKAAASPAAAASAAPPTRQRAQLSDAVEEFR
jgi:eukaryotic-like serine/threonine-protein kinase